MRLLAAILASTAMLPAGVATLSWAFECNRAVLAKPHIVDIAKAAPGSQCPASESSGSWGARHDRVKLCCQGKKNILYIDHVRGIDGVNLSWPAGTKTQLVLHFRGFAMLERLALMAGDQTFETSLRDLKKLPGNGKSGRATGEVFKLLRDGSSPKGGEIVVLVDQNITAGDKNNARGTAKDSTASGLDNNERQLQVSWIDAYR